jgi:hypothetical protein
MEKTANLAGFWLSPVATQCWVKIEAEAIEGQRLHGLKGHLAGLMGSGQHF